MSTKLHHSVLKRIFRTISEKEPLPPEYSPEKIKKILIVNTTAIGDTLLSTPAIRAIRKGFPGAKITALASRAAHSILLRNPNIDSFVVHPGRVNLKYLVRLPLLIKNLKKGSFDLVIVLHANDPDAGPLAYMTGASWRMGFEESGFAFLFTMPIKTRSSIEHVIDVQLKNIGGLGLSPVGRHMEFFLDQDDVAEARPFVERLKKGKKGFIALHPFGSNKNRWWPAERAREFIALFAKSADYSIVIIGGKKEKDEAEGLIKGTEAVSIAGELSIRGAAALIREAALMVTTDSGPMHIAQAMGVPSVVLFGPADPIITGPICEEDIVIQKDLSCAPCLKKQCSLERVECMWAISAKEVFEAALKRLKGV